MKRWKQVKEQLDSKRNGTSGDNSRPAPPYMGGGISSASFSDLRDLRTDPSGSSLIPPMKKSASRTSLDIPGRISNFMSKSNSNSDLSSATGSSNAMSVLRKFPRPRNRSLSNNLGNSDTASNTSPTKLASSPRKWVSSLLNQAGPSTEQLETAAQAHHRSLSDASQPSPAPVSSLVLSPSNNAYLHAPSTSRQVYTLDSGLQRNTSAGGRSASIYSSHLSSASRSTPELHRNSVTRHLYDGAMQIGLDRPLSSLAQSHDVRPPLVVRNLDEAPRGTYTPAIPAASVSAQLRSVSKLRNPWSNSPQIRSEEEDDIDASIAHDRSVNQLDLGERAVLDMLDSASAAGTAVTEPAPTTPYQTATPGTLARSRSFANTTRFHSPASEYSQDFRSPHLAGSASPAAGVREAIRQRELLDSAAARNAAPRPQLRSSQTSSALFYQREASASSSHSRGPSADAPANRITRVPVPTTEVQIASPPKSASSNVFPRHQLTSPIDSSLLGASTQPTSLWSRPGNIPDTPSTTQDPASPMPWSANSLAPGKWPSSSKQGQGTVYNIEPVVTPSEIQTDGSRSDLLRPSTDKPMLQRHRTDFTEATSVFSGSEGSKSQNSLQKEIIAETDPVETKTTEAPTAAVEDATTTPNRPLSHAGSVSSSLAALRGMFSKATSAAAVAVSPSRPVSAVDGASSTSVAAVARELEQRSTPSRPSSPEKLGIPSSPTKAKDLIKMFESNSATASPQDQSHSFSHHTPPRSKLSPSKCGTSTVNSLNTTPKRQTPLTISVSRSNLGPAMNTAAEEVSPINAKLQARRFEAGRFRSRRAGLIGVGGEGGDASFGGDEDENYDDGADENSAPNSAVGDTSRNAHSRFRSLGVASQHTRSQSIPHDISGNVLASGATSSLPRQSPTGSRRGSQGTGSMRTSPGSLGRKGALRNSVIGFMGVLSGRPAPAGGEGGDEGGANRQTLAPGLLSERRHSTKSDQDDNVSNTSAATQGTTASYRRKKEEGNLPLTSTTAIQMSGEQPGTKPLRAGVLYYFNVHDPNPRWLRVKAVLLPSAVAMSWIPSGGGRENVVLDLRACREVHSVPSPDHPSSASDIGAAAARRQGLEQISPFQLIFDDGVERLAADSAKDRVQWVSAVWDVTGTRSPRADSMHGSATANTGHDRPVSLQTSPANRGRGVPDSSPSRPFNSSLGAVATGSPRNVARPESFNNEEGIDRIGSIWKSELSSDSASREMHPSFGEALAGAGSLPPPVPPKESPPALNVPGSGSKSVKSAPTPTAAKAPSLTTTATAVSAPQPTTSTSASPARAKVRSWQRPPLDLSTGFVHDVTPKTPTLVNPPTDTIRSTPASYADDKSTSTSRQVASIGNDEPTTDELADAGDQSPVASSPDMDGYESARSSSSLVDEFGPRTPVSEAVFNWSRLDKESDLHPSDSASQRPARSEFGTIKSNVSAAERKRSTSKKDDGTSQPDTNTRTPAQLLRDTVLGVSTESDAQHEPRHNRLGTVIEETQSQAQSTRLNASVRSHKSKLDELVARAIASGSITSPAAKSALSLVSKGSNSSEAVAELLELIEAREAERLAKEKQLQDQIRSFQQIVSDLQKKNSISSSRRRSSGGAESRVTARSSARDSELAAMQEKLDKVLNLVTNVVATPGVHQRARSESDTPRVGEGGESAELARMEGLLAKLVRRMQVSEEAGLTPRSNLNEWDHMPAELRGNELIKSMQDRAMHGKDGRHEAIQADYVMRNVSSDMARGSSAPGAATPMLAPLDPRRRLSASLTSHPLTPSAVDGDNVSTTSRIPPRSWTSERGIPSPPPNSEWDAKSLLSRATPNPALAPARNFRMLGDPASTSQASPRPVMVTSEPSYGSLDMEAEIRRRRAQQQGEKGGGWYTPKVAQVVGEGETQASSSSVTVEGPNVDKPVPPTPSTPTVRWAVGDVVSDPNAVGKTPDGLGLNVSGAAGGGQFAGPPLTPGASALGAGSTVSAQNGELATILQALKQSELARQTQLQQQTEISRYLNELNAWLERDVVDRSKEWRTLASGVTQLHDELKALKEGRALPADDPSKKEAMEPLVPTPASPIRAASITSTERPLSPITVMGDAGNAPHNRKPSRRKPGGSRKWASSDPKPHDASTWYLPDDDPSAKTSFKSKAAKAASAASGALLIRQALKEWERFKSMQRAAGRPEDPLPSEASDPAAASQLPLPEPMLQKLKEAADAKDDEKVADGIRESAEAGYGTQAIIELTKYVESKAVEVDSDEGSEETLAPTPKGEVVEMATPVPARVAEKAKAVEEKDSEEPASGPTTAALALAVEEILKHLLSTKEEAKRKQDEAAAAAAEREKALLALKDQQKSELVDLLYSRLSSDRAAEEAKAKELDPKTAIESLVSAINSQKEIELRNAAAADAALKQMTSELLKSTSEQNQKLVQAVSEASRDMLRRNVQEHAEEFKRLLHKEVMGMFEDVGKIREAKRQMEVEIADLWSIKNRHLGSGGPMPLGMSVPGGFPQGGMPMPVPMVMPMPQPQITHIHTSPVPAHQAAHISPIVPAGPGAPVEALKAQKRAVKAALKQAVADSAPPAAAPAPAAAAPPAAAAAANTFLAKRKDVLNPFSINFGPRAPVAK